MKMGQVTPVAAQSRRHSDRRGASLIEACLAMALICLIFLGLYQVSRVLAARDVLNHAAARVARARTVGFDDWMVLKVARVATISNAGILLEPVYTNEAPALQAAVANDRAGVLWDRVSGLCLFRPGWRLRASPSTWEARTAGSPSTFWTIRSGTASTWMCPGDLWPPCSRFMSANATRCRYPQAAAFTPMGTFPCRGRPRLRTTTHSTSTRTHR